MDDPRDALDKRVTRIVGYIALAVMIAAFITVGGLIWWTSTGHGT